MKENLKKESRKNQCNKMEENIMKISMKKWWKYMWKRKKITSMKKSASMAKKIENERNNDNRNNENNISNSEI